MNSKYLRIAILVLVDAAIVAFCSIVPLALRFGIFTMDVTYLEPAIKCLPADIVITIGGLDYTIVSGRMQGSMKCFLFLKLLW